MEFLVELEKIPEDKRAYLDEAGIDPREVNEMGYAKKGEKLIGVRSGKKRELRCNMVAAYMNKELTSPFVYQGPMNGDLFLEYLGSVLLPKLEKDTVIILDNFSVHKVKGVKELAENFGMKILYLPPYSPDLNKIEKKWPQIKRIARELNSKGGRTMLSCLEEAIRTVCLIDNIRWHKKAA